MQSFYQYYHRQIVGESFKKWVGAGALTASVLAGSTIPSTAHTHKHVNTPRIEINHQSDLTVKIADYIAQHEGCHSTVYRDSKGFKTIGIGHLLVNSDKVTFLQLFNGLIDYKKIYNGTQSLSKSQIYKLFSFDLNKANLIIKQKYPKFESFPDSVKMALIDSVFRGERHPTTDKLLNAGKWKAAAKAYLDDREYLTAKSSGSGVADRMEQNARSIYSAISESIL